MKTLGMGACPDPEFTAGVVGTQDAVMLLKMWCLGRQSSSYLPGSLLEVSRLLPAPCPWSQKVTAGPSWEQCVACASLRATGLESRNLCPMVVVPGCPKGMQAVFGQAGRAGKHAATTTWPAWAAFPLKNLHLSVLCCGCSFQSPSSPGSTGGCTQQRIHSGLDYQVHPSADHSKKSRASSMLSL